MARNYAQVRCSIWADPEFAALSPDAQRMYLLVLSQAKLSFCGVIDYVPERWSRLTKGMTAADVEILVDELERSRFLFVDREYAELAVRSFVKNDGFSTRWQMVSAMWSAWEATASPYLRDLLVREFPLEVWQHEKAKPPAMALAIRLAIADPMGTPAPTHTHASAPSEPFGSKPPPSLRDALKASAS